MSAAPEQRNSIVPLSREADPLARLVGLTRAISVETVAQRMLRTASRELTELFGADACLISQLEGGLLREVADYARSGQQVARGLSYYLADYPATAAVLESRSPCSISAADPTVDRPSCSSCAKWRCRPCCSRRF